MTEAGTLNIADQETAGALAGTVARPFMSPALVDAEEAAAVCGVSRSHFLAMDKSGRLGPRAIKLGRSSRWSADELRDWARAGCPPRIEWEAMKDQAR